MRIFTLHKRFIMNRIQAIYENGVFRPIQKVDLEEGEKVEITIKMADETDPAADFSDIAVDSGITDLAINIDYYLYGLPKQSEK